MKKIIYSLPIALIAMLSFTCRKSDTAPANALIGQWKFVSAFGGFTGKQVVAANGKDIYTLRQDSTFTATHNDTIKAQGSFHIGTAKSIYTGAMAPAIKFNNSNPYVLFTVKNDSLTLIDNHVEPFSSLYVRIK